jgi:hypothetical protein
LVLMVVTFCPAKSNVSDSTELLMDAASPLALVMVDQSAFVS